MNNADLFVEVNVDWYASLHTKLRAVLHSEP